MASQRTLTAPSSSFLSNPQWTYRVFLSFNGEDTRESFINHLLASLEDKWSIVFGDDDTLEQGKYICRKLLEALLESKCAIVVISKAYAFSKRCLIELTEILKCRILTGLKVFPIFYYVNPSDVQKQKGDFERAFADLRKSSEVDGEQMRKWRAALYEVGGLARRCVLDNRYVAGIIEDIEENMLQTFSVEVSNNSQLFVGIQPQVNKIMTLLRMGSDDVKIMGICGRRGIGKTTLTKVIYDKVVSQFDGRCFFVGLREQNNEQDIVYLQKLILNMGSAVIESRVHNRKVFLVLDDVKSKKQLVELVRSRHWFAKGSRILVISRNWRLLQHCADFTYWVKSLTDAEAFQLFSWNVFSKSHPDEGFLELSQKVVHLAGGHPLALNIISSSLKGRKRAEWITDIDEITKADSDCIAELRSYRSYTDEKTKANYDRIAERRSYMSYIDGDRRGQQRRVNRIIWIVLKLGLERLEKLDIACFFHGLHIDYIISKLDSLYDNPSFAIEILRSKSWVKITKYGEVHIHDLLRRMVLQIVHDESLEELGRCSRLWSYKDIIQVIKNKSGIDVVGSVVLNLPLQEHIQLSFEVFSYMQGLRMLVIKGVCSTSTDYLIDGFHTLEWHGNPLNFMLSNQLCILEWWGYPLISLPTNFEPYNLIELIMRQSCIEYLWMGAKVFKKLKHIDLIKSQNLIKTPDFSEVLNLEILELANCTRLCMVHPSIGLLKRLRQLNLRGCVSLERLPSEVSCLSCLKILDLSGNKFTQIPEGVWQLSDLQELYLEDCSQLKLLPKLPLRLGQLHLKNCPSLYSFCDQIDAPTSSNIWGTIDLSFWSVSFHHGQPYKILHLHRRSPLWIKLRAQIFGTFVACGLTMGPGIPAWFNQRSTPCFGTIGRRTGLDLDEDSKDWKGCAIFIDFEVHEHGNRNIRMSGGSNHTSLYFVCHFQTEEDSLREPLVLCVPEVPLSGRHNVWAYIRAEWFGERRNNLDRWSRLEASNATQNLNVKVNHCGLRLVRQHDLSGMYEALRSISPHVPDLQGWENLFYGDLGTLRVSGPIEGNVMLEENIRPICGPLKKKRRVGVCEYNLSDEKPGSISPHVQYALDPFHNWSDEYILSDED